MSALWTCPRCGRRFGARRRTHECIPDVAIDAWFASRPPVLRAIHDAVLRALGRSGEHHVEAVEVGILIKASRTFAELRPRRDRAGVEYFTLSIVLPSPVHDPRVTRVIEMPGGRAASFIALRSERDVDASVRRWLVEACRFWQLEDPTGRSAVRARTVARTPSSTRATRRDRGRTARS